MQTFLPFPNFSRSARTLDNRRLGKQRVETMQIMKALADPKYGWQSHPAVRMWQGYPHALLAYQRAVCIEWSQFRGFRDTCWVKTIDVYLDRFDVSDEQSDLIADMPSWHGDPALHLSHRSNLLRKDREWYGPQFEPGLSDALPYVWPTSPAGQLH